MLPWGSREPGVYVSDVISDNPNYWVTEVGLWVYVADMSGSPTLDVSLEQSLDGETWNPLPGSSIPTLSTVGNAFANASANPDNTYFLRVTSTVTGDVADEVTYRVLAVTGVD